VAPALALAEPQDAQRPRPNEGGPASGRPTRHHRGTTTRETTVFLLREPLAMPQLPFMHNVRRKGQAQVGEARLWLSP
jgi:hypothetical protein